jgi:hypothetical protein
MPFANGLGNKYDLGTGFVPVDMSGGANTGKRVFMGHADAVDVVFIKAAGTAGDDPVLTLQQHTAASGGTSSNLAAISKYWVKSEATLDNDETWSEVTQAAAATITDPGGAGTSAESEQIVVFTVSKDQLTGSNKYISVNVADVGTNAQLGTVLYIFHGLSRHASPTGYLNPLVR